MTVKVTEVDLTNKGYTKEEVDAKLEEKQGVFTPQAPLAFNGDKTQLSVDLSGYQPVGDYATKTELAGKADSSVVESLSTQVATNTSDISIIKTKQEEDGNKIDALDKEMATKQDLLVSGTNIKTINSQSLLGEGNLEISGSGGTTDYTQLTNKPQINSVELSGNKSLSDLGIQPAGNYIEAGTGTQPQINTITVLTQEEYDGLSTKDPNTQYLIVE